VTIKKIVFLVFSIISLTGFAFGQEALLQFQPSPSGPFWETQEIGIDSSEYNTVQLRIKAEQNGMAQLFWATSYDPRFDQYKTIAFPLKQGIHKYTINVPSQNPNWIGWVKKIILLPGVPIEIQSVKIMRGNLLTNIASGWQEFWGPRGRLIIGSTINTIQPVNLFGRSIFVYIYWVIGLSTFAFLAYQLYLNLKKQSFEQIWLETGKFTVFLTIIFWVLLETSSLFNNWLALKSDWKYVGKSQDERLALANTGDFYAFIKFCQANMPQDSKFDMRIPPIYNDIKARYYLYPREQTTVEADYLIVYDQAVEPAVKALCSPYKSFRENAYIMRPKQK